MIHNLVTRFSLNLVKIFLQLGEAAFFISTVHVFVWKMSLVLGGNDQRCTSLMSTFGKTKIVS